MFYETVNHIPGRKIGNPFLTVPCFVCLRVLVRFFCGHSPEKITLDAVKKTGAFRRKWAPGRKKHGAQDEKVHVIP